MEQERFTHLVNHLCELRRKETSQPARRGSEEWEGCLKHYSRPQVKICEDCDRMVPGRVVEYFKVLNKRGRDLGQGWCKKCRFCGEKTPWPPEPAK